MNPIFFIRTKILGLSQTALSKLAKVSQSEVSRWESGDTSPTLKELILLRKAVLSAGKRWNEKWLWEPPK